MHHKNHHILLDPPSKLRFDESLRSRMFEVLWGFVIIPTPYAYPNLLNKRFRPLLNVSTKLFVLPFWFFLLMQVKTSHGGWCRYAFESSSCTSRTWKAWRSTARRDCFLMTTRRRIAQVSGAHSSWSFGMGSSTIS